MLFVPFTRADKLHGELVQLLVRVGELLINEARARDDCFYVGGRCRDRAVLDSNRRLTQDRQHLVSVKTANAVLFQHFRDA